MNRRSIFSLSAMTGLGLAATAILGMSSGAAHAQTAEDLVGTWQLVSTVNTAADGTKTEAFGPNPAGMTIFTTDGHFIILLLRNDLPKIASNNRMQATADENKAIVQGSLGLFGTYAVRDKVVTFKVDGGTYPNWNGTDQKRDITAFNDNEMAQTLPATTIGGRAEQTWKRIK
jgi:hypothetical protein